MTWIRNWIQAHTVGEHAPETHYDMDEVMRRVDEQVGQAVEKLADR